MIFASRSEAISAAEYPSSARTSSLCSPSSGERVTSVGLSDSPTEVKRSPLLGEHNEEVLAELGYSKSDIAALRESKII